MKPALLLCLLLLIVPAWLLDFKKDKLILFSSLSYYGSDFDGDKLQDLSVWDPKTNTLYFQQTSDKQFYQKKLFDTDLNYTPVFADYDGDGKTDFVFYEPDSGEWVSFNSLQSTPVKTFLGNCGDLPIPTDLDGDKKYDISIWRPNVGAWVVPFTDETGNKNRKIIQEGSYQDSVFAGDYDGDGKSDLIVWRPDDGYWHVVKSSTNFDFSQSEHIQHGKEWDVIVPNDYDNDGRCDLVFWRPQDGTWYFVYSGSNTPSQQIKFGSKDDIPLSGDLNGDKIPELITWNISKKSWNVLDTTKGESYSYKWNVPDGCIPASTILQKFE